MTHGSRQIILALAMTAGASFAANAGVAKHVNTANGSDVTINDDGTASLSNPRMRWSASGNWTKKGTRYCVDWHLKGWQIQCY